MKITILIILLAAFAVSLPFFGIWSVVSFVLFVTQETPFDWCVLGAFVGLVAIAIVSSLIAIKVKAKQRE